MNSAMTIEDAVANLLASNDAKAITLTAYEELFLLEMQEMIDETLPLNEYQESNVIDIFTKYEEIE